jgi:hypothetical protein
MLSSGANVIILSYCYHLELMLSSGANVIIWDDNTPLFIFLENFTHWSISGLHRIASDTVFCICTVYLQKAL